MVQQVLFFYYLFVLVYIVILLQKNKNKSRTRAMYGETRQQGTANGALAVQVGDWRG